MTTFTCSPSSNTPVPVMYRYLNTKDLAEKTQRMKCRQTCRHFLPTLPTLPTLVMCVGSVGADSADMSAKMPTLSLPTLVSADTLVLPTLFESGLAADNRYTRYIDYQLWLIATARRYKTSSRWQAPRGMLGTKLLQCCPSLVNNGSGSLDDNLLCCRLVNQDTDIDDSSLRWKWVQKCFWMEAKKRIKKKTTTCKSSACEA